MSRQRPLAFDPIQEAHRQWLAHGWGEPEHMAAATSIMRAQQIVLSRVEAALRPFSLTFARFEALALLFFTRRGSLPLGKMGDRLMVHPSSITNTIDRLEADGLVRRVPHPVDGRATLAEITPAGRSLVQRAAKALQDVRFGLGELADRELPPLVDAVTALRARAGDFTTTQTTHT